MNIWSLLLGFLPRALKSLAAETEEVGYLFHREFPATTQNMLWYQDNAPGFTEIELTMGSERL
jgi:hypothetical protein